MTPEYFNYLLTGVDMNEYTNATSTGLVDAQTRTWAPEILGALGYPAHMFGPIHMPGETVGQLRREIAQEVGFNCTVSLVASHDTASAVMAVPLADEHSIYISSGTWSLMGVELNNPITTERSRQYNLTNEGGYNGTYCYLKTLWDFGSSNLSAMNWTTGIAIPNWEIWPGATALSRLSSTPTTAGSWRLRA